MSDFLKKFSDDTYKDGKKTNIREESEENQTYDVEVETPTHVAKAVQETKVIMQPRGARFEHVQTSQDEDAIFQTSNTKEEVYIRDDEKIKRRKHNIMIAIISTVFILCIGVLGYRKASEVRVPQFVNEKTLNDVQVWAAKNKIELNYTSVFSTRVDEGYVVKQAKKSGAIIQKGSDFEIVLSKGANPEEHIRLPDFMKMSLTEIEDWKRKEKVSNITIEKVFSEEVEKSKTIRFEFKTEGIDAKNYRRKDKINIVVSKGKEVYEKDIEVPDFKDKNKAEVEAWAKEKEVTVQFHEEANDKIMEGNVVSQDIVPKTKIAKKDVINVIVSRGKISFAPNFAGLDETQGQVEAARANVSITPVYYYSDSVPASYLISQSVPVGVEVRAQSIALVYSLGKPYIGNYDGQDVYEFCTVINEMNGKGAQLTYEIVEVNSSEKEGSIITSNYKANFVNLGTHIVISVSKGS